MLGATGNKSTSNFAPSFDRKLAGYLAATGAIGAAFAREAHAAVVANTTVQPFGINGQVNIDFNNDSQTDFQIDHDRYNLNGTDIDYLQLDKNDVNGAANPLPIDALAVFPNSSGHPNNNDHKYLTDGGEIGVDAGEYIAALDADFEIGPASVGVWEFQETTDFNGDGVPPQYVRRANRLIDEDHGQIDDALPPTSPVPDPPPGSARFLGNENVVKYLGVAIDLQDAGYTGNELPSVNGPDFVDNPLNYWYGWIGIRILDEDDATGEVVGYAYESVKGMSILAGDVGTPGGLPGDFNGDSVVDAVDYTVWRNHLGDTDESALNNNGDGGGVTVDDYTWWKDRYGDVSMGSGAGSIAAPEPSSLILCALGACWLIGRFLSRRFLRGR